MKKHPERQAKLRELILRENSIKAAASEMGMRADKVYRFIPLLGITQLWVTNEEKREILQKRK